MTKKTIILLSALSLLFSVGGCKPKRSAYRQIYEQAKQREVAQYQESGQVSNQETEASSSTVIVSKPAQTDIGVRKERLSLLQGEDASRLNSYSVVIGSFQNHSNAYSLKERMESAGYRPVLAQNEQGMLRVIISSFGSRGEAENSRNQIIEEFAPAFADAWILERDR